MLLGVVALTFIAFYLCLHDRVTRGTKEVIVVSEDEISRACANPMLSLLTSVTDVATNVSRRTFSIPRSEIKSIVVSTGDMIVIEHTHGAEYIAATDWVNSEATRNIGYPFRKWPHHADKKRHPPLVETLLTMKFPVRFS